MLMFALGVTSGKENRWFKDISQISADPPSPNLIFDFFILDKYKLVFTPSHSKMSEIKIILNFWFELDPHSPIWSMSLNHLFFFLRSPLSFYFFKSYELRSYWVRGISEINSLIYLLIWIISRFWSGLTKNISMILWIQWSFSSLTYLLRFIEFLDSGMSGLRIHLWFFGSISPLVLVLLSYHSVA